MARRLELTPRLQQLADWVPQGARVADIGTDHGYLPTWLVLQGRVSGAIAADLRHRPLERARAAGRAWSVGDRISYRLCSGLTAIGAGEVDVIVIAGMGGENIAAILSAAPWTADGRHTLLLQPQSRAEELRSFLAGHGYAITRETLVLDRGVLYPVLEARAGEMHPTLGQLWGGVALGEEPLGERYIIEKILRLQQAVAGLSHSRLPADRARADSLRDILTALLELREERRHAHCP